MVKCENENDFGSQTIFQKMLPRAKICENDMFLKTNTFKK